MIIILFQLYKPVSTQRENFENLDCVIRIEFLDKFDKLTLPIMDILQTKDIKGALLIIVIANKKPNDQRLWDWFIVVSHVTPK